MMKTILYSPLTAALIGFLVAPSASSASCPIPPTSIEPDVRVETTFDKSSGIYTYRYSLSNGKAALLPIHIFALQIDHEPQSILSPMSWISNTSETDGNVDRHQWSSATASKLVVPDSTVSGFVITSNKSPGLTQYFARGKTTALESVSFNGDDEAFPDCPGFYLGQPFQNKNVSGITQGPVGDSLFSVEIELKDSKGERDYGPVSPYEGAGSIYVLLKGKKNLDIKDIDLSSLRLGIGKAPITSSRTLGRSNNLLLQFDLQKVAIECGRDRVLLLSGKTKDKKAFIGGTPIKTKKCEKRPTHGPRSL